MEEGAQTAEYILKGGIPQTVFLGGLNCANFWARMPLIIITITTKEKICVIQIVEQA